MRRDDPTRTLRRLLALLLFFCVLWLVVRQQVPPTQPLPEDAPADQVSASRAVAALRHLLKENRPHPVGTHANRVVRDRLIERFRGMGYSPRIQRRWSCHEGRCANVENLVVEAEGADPESEAVLVAVHYDSVMAGPGAADDGSGVSIVLELARILSEEDPWPRTVVFLLTDGEEAGLLGARAFAEADPLLEEIGAVINLEARGNTGRSLLFETSLPNAWLVDHYGAVADHPSTSSLYADVYRRLPNDTDYTIFQDHGIPGVNFAFIAGLPRYHTRTDDIAHLDLRSVQHQGGQALSMLRSLTHAEALGGTKNAVYTSVLGWFLLSWSEAMSMALALAGSVGVLVLAAWAWWREELRVGWTVAATFSLLFLGLLTGLLAAGIDFGLRQVAEWHGHPIPFLIGLWLLAGGLALTHAAGMHRAGRGGAWTAVYLAISALAVLSAREASAASYLFVIPVLGAVAGRGVGWTVREIWVRQTDEEDAPSRDWVADLGGGLGAIPGLVIWLDLAMALSWALDTFAVLLLPTMVVGWMLLAGLWASNRRDVRLGVILWVVALVAFSFTFTGTPSSAERPRGLTLAFYQDDSGARWLARDAEDAMGAIPSFEHPFREFVHDDRSPLGLPLGTSWSKEANPKRVAKPRLQILSEAATGSGRTVTAQLRSQRGAHTIGLKLPTDSPVQTVVADGQRLYPQSNGLLMVHSDEPVVLTFTVGSYQRTGVTVFDITSALPEGAPRRGTYEMGNHVGDLFVLADEGRL